MSMFPKFDAVPVHGIFEINGTSYRKSGAFTYFECMNESMGEFTINPYHEARITEAPLKPKAETIFAAKESDIKK